MERLNLKILPLSILIVMLNSCNENNEVAIPEELPKIANAVFTNPTTINNPYYGPGDGKIYLYKGGAVGQALEEEIQIERRSTTKIVSGVVCIIHHDLVYKNKILIEDTDDWLAQDDKGNLWYFGEFVKNYDDAGNFSDNDGSWEYGVDNALPGYWMPANPMLGQAYYQEFYEGEAEDQAEVISVGVSITIGLGTYTNCVVTKDYTKFEPGVYEKKYYAPSIGFIKEEKFENNILIETLELVAIME